MFISTIRKIDTFIIHKINSLIDTDATLFSPSFGPTLMVRGSSGASCRCAPNAHCSSSNVLHICRVHCTLFNVGWMEVMCWMDVIVNGSCTLGQLWGALTHDMCSDSRHVPYLMPLLFLACSPLCCAAMPCVVGGEQMEASPGFGGGGVDSSKWAKRPLEPHLDAAKLFMLMRGHCTSTTAIADWRKTVLLRSPSPA